MPVTIPDEVLQDAKMSERELRTEIACRLFDAEKLHKPAAVCLAGITRAEFEEELLNRGLSLIHLDEEYVRHELPYVKEYERADRDRSAG